MSRWWHGVEVAWSYSRDWTKHRFSHTFMAIEMDSLSSGTLMRLMFSSDNKSSCLNAAEETSMEERALKMGRLNALEVSLVFLSEEARRAKLRCVLVAASEVGKWHRLQNHKCRSILDNDQWFREQVSGGFFQHIDSVWARLLDRSSLEIIGFWLPGAGGPLPAAEALQAEQDLAQLFGELVLAMIAARTTRSVFLCRGWPHRALRILEGGEAASCTIALLRADWANYNRLLSNAQAGDAIAQVLVRRSVMSLLVVQQLAFALQSSPQGAWATSAPLEAHLCEDSFNLQKNSNIVKHRGRYMRPAKAAFLLFSKKVASKIHKYKDVSGPGAPLARRLALSRSCFQSSSASKVKLRDIFKGGAAPPWSSPGSDRHAVAHCDLALVNDALSGDADMFASTYAHCWVGDLLDFKNQLAVRRRDGTSWYIGLRHLPGTAAIAWPVTLKVCAKNQDMSYFVPSVRRREPSLLTFTSLDDWVGARFELASPAWQHASANESAKDFPLQGTRFFRSSEVEPLEVIAARHAFFSLPLSCLRLLVEEKGCALPPGCSLCQALWLLCSSILNLDSDDVQGIVEKRLIFLNDIVEKSEGAFAQCEEIDEVLEKQDEQSAAKEVEAYEDRKSFLQTFRNEFVAKVGGARQRGGRLPPIKAPSGARYPRCVPPTIPHAEAKAFAPPDSKLWKSSDGHWHGRYKSYGEVCRRIVTYSEQGALNRVLAELWTQHLTFCGRPLKDCPIAGLFQD